MRVLVTGSSGHLGEALMRLLMETHHRVVGVDILASEFTTAAGSITDRSFVADCVDGCDAILHTATLHKPHIATHTAQDFVDTNVSGTLNLLEEAVTRGCRCFIFTSTTSTFGRALTPSIAEPAAWITEEVHPIPKNIYGVTKAAAEDLCEFFSFRYGLPCLILKTSRFFPEEDDSVSAREGFADLNLKVNELLFRRLDIKDAAQAHLLALDRAERIGFGRYILSATSPFTKNDLLALRTDPEGVVAKYVDFQGEYARRGWRFGSDIDRVYVNERARKDLDWEPRYTFIHAINRLRRDESPFSDLMHKVGSKGYHQGRTFDQGPYPVT